MSSVLGGTWQRKVSGRGTCTYSSDRGAIFAIQPIDEPPSRQRAALADARVHSCGGKKPRDVPGTGGAFTCVEKSSSGDTVEGNVVARGYYWLFVAIGMGSNPTYPAQTKAIAALLKIAAD